MYVSDVTLEKGKTARIVIKVQDVKRPFVVSKHFFDHITCFLLR